MEKTTGQIIKEQRVKKRLTQAAIAEQLNVTDKAVSKWERDISRPDIGLIPKISEILEIPAELLLNIPLTPQEAEDNGQKERRKKGKFEKAEYTLDDEDAFDEYVFHKAAAISLLKKGALGFAGGVLFTLITALSDNDPFHIGFAMAIGFFTSGIPYGWQLLERIIGSWFVVGSIPIMLLAFVFKLAGAIMIGWFTYPVALFYHLFKSQRKGSTARKVYMGLFAGTIALIAIFLLITCWSREKKQSQVMEVQQPVPVVVEESQNTQPEESKIMIDASYFHPTKVAYEEVFVIQQIEAIRIGAVYEDGKFHIVCLLLLQNWIYKLLPIRFTLKTKSILKKVCWFWMWRAFGGRWLWQKRWPLPHPLPLSRRSRKSITTNTEERNIIGQIVISY